MEWLKLKLDLDYMNRKSRYDMECELLRLKREQFYIDNPDFPYGTMYMQVISPPQKVEIKIITPAIAE